MSCGLDGEVRHLEEGEVLLLESCLFEQSLSQDFGFGEAFVALCQLGGEGDIGVEFDEVFERDAEFVSELRDGPEIEVVFVGLDALDGGDGDTQIFGELCLCGFLLAFVLGRELNGFLKCKVVKVFFVHLTSHLPGVGRCLGSSGGLDDTRGALYFLSDQKQSQS